MLFPGPQLWEAKQFEKSIHTDAGTFVKFRNWIAVRPGKWTKVNSTWNIIKTCVINNFNFRISKPKIKQKKLKEESPPKDATRKKSLANTSGASILYVGKMSQKDRRLLKMILVIFLSFLFCYLPITLTKVMRSISEVNFLFIMGYLLVYLTTCINPCIYVVSWYFGNFIWIISDNFCNLQVMSSEYRQAYKNLLMCRLNSSNGFTAPKGRFRESRRRK